MNYPDEPGRGGSSFEPELAAALPTVSGGGRTYSFRIRPGYRFSPPSGEPVTAATMEYSIERSLTPRIGSPGAGLWGDVKAVHAAGDTLTVRLARPSPTFLARITTPFFCAVPIGTPIDPEGVQRVPAAGPYFVASYVPSEEIVLRKNPDSAGPRPRRVDEIRGALGRGNGGHNRKGRAGRRGLRAQCQLADSRPQPGQPLRAWQPGGPRRQTALLRPQDPSLDHLVFNTSRPPFSSPRLRRAVNFALDHRPGLAARRGSSSACPPTPLTSTSRRRPRALTTPRLSAAAELGPSAAARRRRRRRVVLYNIGGPATERSPRS